MSLFKSREDAAMALAGRLSPVEAGLKNALVLGIPRGGVPIGYYVAEALHGELDAIVLRKLPVPQSPEVGFGAVTIDKTVVLNEPLLEELGLSRKRVEEIVSNVYREVLRRNRIYRGNRPFPQVNGRSVVLTDDGLATGFTMLAAIRHLRKLSAQKIVVAVPVAHRQAYETVAGEADATVVLYISDAPHFAVASFYDSFPDMADEEVVGFLKDNARRK